jgi:AraC-binding-like domain
MRPGTRWLAGAEVMLVDLAFTTRDVAPPDRVAAWQEMVTRLFIPLAITPLGAASEPGRFEAAATARDLGGVRVWRVTGSPMAADRASRHIGAPAAGDYLLAVHVRGTARASQDGRDVDLGPGDFALFDSTRPYSIAFRAPGRFAHIIYQVPRASLDARRQAGKVTALRVPAASAPGQLHLGPPAAPSVRPRGAELRRLGARAAAAPVPRRPRRSAPAPPGHLRDSRPLGLPQPSALHPRLLRPLRRHPPRAPGGREASSA